MAGFRMSWPPVWLVVLAVSGCAAERLPPITAGPVVRDEHERALLARSAEVHAAVIAAGSLDHDEHVTRYLDGIASKLLSPLGAPAFDIRPLVVRTADPIAMSLPDGTIYVAMGMLALLEDEAELAFVLAHEITHVLQRHAAATDRESRQRQGTVKTVTDVVAASLAVATLNPHLYVTLPDLADPVRDHALFSHLSTYSQALEHEADAMASTAVAAAGYSAAGSVRVLEHLDEFVRHEDRARRTRYPSHPEAVERITHLRRMLPATANGATNTRRYRTIALRYLPAVTHMHLAVGRRIQARRTADHHVAWAPESAEGYCLRGDVARTAAGPRRATNEAIAAYEQCLRRDPQRAAAFRELGLLYRATNRPAAARDAFAKYLDLAPDAVDRGIIEAYRTELEEPS